MGIETEWNFEQVHSAVNFPGDRVGKKDLPSE
jgi:hypothetical protein